MVTLSWVGEEVIEHDALEEKATAAGQEVADFAKGSLRRLMDD